MSLIDLLSNCGKNPDILINGDKKLTDLFLQMTTAFYKETSESEFAPFSINDKTSLLIPDETQKYFIWEQISRQNQHILSQAQNIDFDKEEDDGINIDVEEEEEINDIDNIEETPIPQNEEEEDENEQLSIDKSHISDEENGFDENEEEEESGDIFEDGINEDEYNRLLLEADDAQGNEQFTYKDLYGDAPPTSDHNDSEDELDEKGKKIKEIESKLISPKSWEMSGETLATNRPLDSLADIDIDFDFGNAKPPNPLSTSEIEKILINRIESMNFDDVVRKKKTVETARQLIELTTEKPKLGLADEYANEYLKQMTASSTNENELTAQQREALDLWHSLEHELNRFTEKRYMTKRPKESITITQGISLDVEEKPEATQAPEEIMAPVGSIRQMKGDSEVTHDERKAERRSKKAKKQKEQIAKDAAKGILYSQQGGDGAEIKIQQDIKRLQEGNLQGITVVKPGETLQLGKDKKKMNNKFLL